MLVAKVNALQDLARVRLHLSHGGLPAEQARALVQEAAVVAQPLTDMPVSAAAAAAAATRGKQFS